MSKPPVDIDPSTPVVVFRADGYCSLGIVRTLGRLGVKVYCISHIPDEPAMRSRYCAGTFNWDFDSSPADDSVQFLLDVAQKIGQKAILLPTFDTRSLFVDTYRALLSTAFLLPQPSPGAVSGLYSKRSMYELCKEVGVPTPDTIFPDSVEQAMRDGPGLEFPLLIKGIDADRLMHRTGRRAAVVHHPAELRDAYLSLDEPGRNNLALQAFIPHGADDSWILGAYFDSNGDCRFAMTGQKLRQTPISGGVTTLGICAPCEPMVQSVSLVARAVGYRGILDACFLYDRRTNSWQLLDVNPRPGANFRLFVDRNHLDVVRALYLDLTNQSIPTTDPVWGRQWMVEDKDFDSVRQYASNGSLKFGAWFKSLCVASERGYIDFDDLRPSIVFATAFARRALRSAVTQGRV